MTDPAPLELVQEQYREQAEAETGCPARTIGDVVSYTAQISPRSTGDWHLSLLTHNWWTGEILANFDARLDNLDTVLEVLEAEWAHHYENRDESLPERPEITT